MRASAAPLGLAAVLLLAFAARVAGLEWVFVGPEETVFVAGDGLYHARRALWSFVNFPSVLVFDPYVNHPDGAVVMLPPLLDFAIAGIARLFGNGLPVFERTLAWSTPIYGTLVVLPVFWIGRRLGGVSVGLLAGAFYALLPLAVDLSRVGNADHHAAVSLFGALLLAGCIAAVAPGSGPRATFGWIAVLALARLAMATSWSGSLLYLGLTEATLLLAGSLSGRRDVLDAQWRSAALFALALVPVVAWLPTPVGGPFSAGALSWLHVATGLLAALLAGLTNAWQARAPSPAAAARLARLATLGAGALAALGLALLLPGVREGLWLALGLFSGSVQHSDLPTLELMPLFSLPGRPASRPAVYYYGLLAYLIPLAPLAPWLGGAHAQHRLERMVLSGWCLVLGALAIWQLRYAGEFAAAGCVAFALLVAGVARGLMRVGAPRGLAYAVVAAIVAALLFHGALRAAIPFVQTVRGHPPTLDRALASIPGSMMRFMKTVDAVTPKTAGFLDAGRPAYGVICDWGIGHALHYWARRASAADGFGSLLAPDRFAEATGFFRLRDEAQAAATARRLEARYVITHFRREAEDASLRVRLHRDDGRESRHGPRLERFRLVTEGPEGGQGASDITGRQKRDGIVPYKLWEVVEGARIVVAALPGERVSAELELAREGGRTFTVRAQARARAIAQVRLRVPYASASQGEDPRTFRATGPWRVRAGRRSMEVVVTRDDVREGRMIEVSFDD